MGDKYEKSFEIILTNKTSGGLLPKSSVMMFHLNKPIIIPPMSRYILKGVVAEGLSQVSFILSIPEFTNKCFVGDSTGGRMINGLLHVGDFRDMQAKKVVYPVDICNKEPITLSSLSLRVSDFLGQPSFITDTGAFGGTAIEFALVIQIQQDPQFEAMNIQKRNAELLRGLQVQKMEITNSI